MMSWIAWIHGLVGSCDSNGVTVQVSSWFGLYLFGLEILVSLGADTLVV